MNSLQENNQINLSPLLDATERDMIISKSGKKIKELKRVEVKTFLSMLILKTHLECGQVADEKVIDLTITELLDDVISYAGGFTLNQVVHAFKLGRIKEFGDWFGLNNNTYEQWIRGYLGWQKRFDANKTQERYLEEINKPKQMTQEEKDKIMKEASIRAFEIFKKDGGYNDMGNSIYGYLDRIGIIKYTPLVKRVFMEEARILLLSKKKNELLTVGSLEVGRKIKKEISDLESDTIIDERIVLAKKLALQKLFTDLNEIGTELKEIL